MNKKLRVILSSIFLVCVTTQAFSNPNSFVSQTNIFSGEVASNLTTGAPLSVSSTGTITTGITNSSPGAFSSNLTTTGACTGGQPTVAMTGVTETPVSGTYLVIFSAWFTHSNGNATVTFSVGIGGTAQAKTTRVTTPFEGSIGSANNGKEAGTNGIVTVNGSQAIAMLWCTSTGTVTAHAGEMDVVRLQ